jgi:hypothetical protein
MFSLLLPCLSSVYYVLTLTEKATNLVNKHKFIKEIEVV